MNKYNKFGQGCNIPSTELIDHVVERRARSLSRETSISYYHAVAVVLANAITKGASSD
jgi:hypothetical protein